MARPKKIIHFKLTPYRNAAGTESWRVSGTKPGGVRVRQNFSDKAEALQTMADLEGELAGSIEATRSQRTRLSPGQLADAEAALQSAGGQNITDIVSHYLNLKTRASAKGINLDTALSFMESHYRAETKAVSILNAYGQFVASRASGSPATKAYYEATLRLLLEPDPNKFVHAFTVSDIESVLGRYDNVNSKRTYRGAFSTFFRWAVRHHYCLESPCARLDKLPKDMSQIVILSLDEVKRLLYASMIHQNGAAAARVAIGVFAGLRSSELDDLMPEDIGEKVIRVSGGKMRRKLKRTVPIPPVLAAWLKEYPFTGLPGGWGYKQKVLKKATKATQWVQDILRHTSMSYQVERDKNEALTAYNNGTSIKMMDRHYRNSIDDEKTITEFWSLTPAKVMKTKPDVTLPERKHVAWPEKKALEKLVWQKPLMHAAAEIGVSDVALKKHCLKLGIALPTAGHWLRRRRDRSV